MSNQNGEMTSRTTTRSHSISAQRDGHTWHTTRVVGISVGSSDGDMRASVSAGDEETLARKIEQLRRLLNGDKLELVDGGGI